MHYHQTIIDAALAQLQALNTLTGGASSTRFFAEPTPNSARVFMTSFARPPDIMVRGRDDWVMLLTVTLFVRSDNAPEALNTILEELDNLLIPALEVVADCATQEGPSRIELAVDQDREVLAVDIDYSVEYATVLGDAATRSV